MCTIQEKISKLTGHDGLSYEEKMYVILQDDEYKARPYQYEDLRENMALVHRSMGGWWKPRYLVNHETKRAYEIMNSHEILTFVQQSDINWESLSTLDGGLLKMAKDFNGQYPVLLRGFANGVAMIEWQLNPDGMYFMDEDGFGMTNDIEVSLYGYIDKHCKVVIPFTYIEGHDDELQRMRNEAERIVSKK